MHRMRAILFLPIMLRRGVCVGAGFLFALAALAAAEPDPALGPIVELPKFEVTDSRLLPPPESWQYAELPGFELLSNLRERETKRFMRDFLLLQDVIAAIMPGLNRGQSPVPTALILCGRAKGFEDFLPADRANEQFSTNALFFKNAERAAIVVDFALTELQLDNETVQESDPYHGFYKEYFRFLIRRQVARAPEWFEEGLVQIFAATEFDRKTIYFAQIGDGFGGGKTGDFNRTLQGRGLIAFKDFLRAGPPERRDAFWEAQCYAFVHFCLYGNNQKYQQPFVKFVERVTREDFSEELFKECFGKTSKAVATELAGYLDFTAYKTMQFKAKKGRELPEPPVVALRPAPDAVVGRLKGETLRLAGHGAAARNFLVAPYVRGERDPQLLAALGLDERVTNEDARARKFLEAAAAAKVNRARAYLELARLRLIEARSVAGEDRKLDAAQTESVVAPLLVARNQPPRMAEVYGLLVETWMNSAVSPTREQFEIVLEGARAFSREPRLILVAALLGAQCGFPEARLLAEHGVKIAANDADRDRFSTLAATLARDAEKTSPPSPPPTSP